MEMKKTVWMILIVLFLLFLGAALLHAQGPVAAYGFNENSGTTTSDAAGNSQTGAISGAAWTAGKFGSALSFNGSSSKVTVQDSAFLHLTNKWTLEAWINPTIVPTSDRVVMVKGGDNYYIAHISQGRVIGGGHVGSTWAEAYGTTTIPVNTWTHVAVTYDGSNIRLYQNAVEVRVRSFSGSFTVTTKALEIGWNSADTSQYFSGKIDEVRLYSRALTPSEIQTDMNTPIAVQPPADTTPPVLSNKSPTGTLVAGTTQTVMSLTTNENATCRHSTSAGLAYASMTGTFNTSNGLTHAASLSGLTNGSTYNYFARCIDVAGNANPSDYPISFSVAVSIPPPVPGIVSYDKHPDDPVQIIWDFDPAFQSLINGFGLYAGQTATGPWVFYDGISDPVARKVDFVSPDKTTYFTMNACKQTSATAGECSVMSNVIKVNCIPLSELFLWQSYLTRPCQ